MDFINDGVVETSRGFTRAEQRRLDELRTLLARLTDTVAAGRQLSGPELAELNAVSRRLPVRAHLQAEPDGGYVVAFDPVGGKWIDRTERVLAGSFGSILRRSRRPRLKRCADEICQASVRRRDAKPHAPVVRSRNVREPRACPSSSASIDLGGLPRYLVMHGSRREAGRTPGADAQGDAPVLRPRAARRRGALRVRPRPLAGRDGWHGHERGHDLPAPEPPAP